MATRNQGALLLAVVLIGTPAAAADTIEATSRIIAVTVFPDRAGVSRRSTMTLAAGSHVIRIAPLPAGLDPDTLSATGSGEAAVTLYGVRVETIQLERAQDPSVSALEEEIRVVTRNLQSVRNVKRVLEQEQAYLASIQAASSEQIGKDLITKSPSATDAAALLAFLDESLLKTYQRDQEADAQLQTLSLQLDRLQRELARLTQNRAKQQSAMLVDVEVASAGRFTLEVSYHVSGATWEPAYEARALTSEDRVALGMSGLVRQQTGEDWTEVPLTLSTARPARAGSMPKLEPYFLQPWEPAPMVRGGRMDALYEVAPEKTNDAARRLQGLAAPTALPVRAAQVAAALVQAQGPSVTFKLQKPTSIPSDWQPHKVPIGSHAFSAEFAYELTPRLVSFAFLRAKVTNTTDMLYLPGPVAVFLDGAFVATAALEQVAPGEPFDLYLGVDERVRVERRPLKERVEVGLLPGLRGKMKATDYEWLTTIENFTGRTVAMSVFDQVPVSQREEITVEAVKYTPTDVEKDPEKPGVFHWVLELIPSQKQELRLAYRVRHPVEMRLQ